MKDLSPQVYSILGRKKCTSIAFIKGLNYILHNPYHLYLRCLCNKN